MAFYNFEIVFSLFQTFDNISRNCGVSYPIDGPDITHTTISLGQTSEDTRTTSGADQTTAASTAAASTAASSTVEQTQSAVSQPTSTADLLPVHGSATHTTDRDFTKDSTAITSSPLGLEHTTDTMSTGTQSSYLYTLNNKTLQCPCRFEFLSCLKCYQTV